MRKMILLVATMLFAVIASPAAAQDAAKKDAAPKPAKGLSQAVLEQWNDIGRKLTAMAEDFPEDKYDFKPTPAQRSFAEQMLHATASMYYFTDPAQGQKPRYPDDPKRDGLKTKAEIVPFSSRAVNCAGSVVGGKHD